MKLSLCALLVALALCCYQTDAAIICPALAGQLSTFILAPENVLKVYMAQFHAPKAAEDAALRWKACYNEALPLEKRKLILGTLVNIVAACKKE
ncbi:secretoglobin family 1D member 2-like [Sorex araneus]|uniref:secretoglobin family 1D member 2-like n=1 Tax=Sorex araneus TaxID=42254 RepID=UPI0024340B5A|nr:secretoglobin family 1D member 2-like [Sorex araneus]